MINYFLLGFFLTFLIEVVIVFYFIKNKKNLFLYIFLINLFTWPIANFFSIYVKVMLIEIGVILVESVLLVLLFDLKYKKSLLLSLIMNIASFLLPNQIIT